MFQNRTCIIVHALVCVRMGREGDTLPSVRMKLEGTIQVSVSVI